MAKLVTGVNDLQSKFPKIAEEWDYELNFPLTPDKITYGSEKKVFWKCKNGHSFKASINKRTSMNSGCPICAGKKILKGFNDLESLRPDLSNEWHPTKNGDLKPSDVTLYSGRKVWWRCKLGHEWKSSVYNRANGNGCPICSNHKVLAGFNDLFSRRPDLIKEWNYDKNGNLKPSDVMLFSHKKVWWRCSKHPDHEWETSVNNRTSGDNGCPICSGQQVLKGFNDLETLNPNLAKEWHPTKNGDLKPSDVTLFSHRKVWWKCSKNENHEWQAIVSSRSRGCGCPICAKERMVSFPEKIIAYYLKKVLPVRENIFIDKWNVDILCDNIAIEYDGEYFHSHYCVDKDDFENKDLSELGFTVIRILGRDESNYVKKSDFRYEIQESNYEHFKMVIKDLCNYLCVDCPDVDVKRDEKEIRKLMDGY